MPFNLFALVNGPGARVWRFDLSADVQAEITDHFTHIEGVFTRSAGDEIPFDGKYKPDDGEVLVIDNFDDIDNLHHAIENPLAVLPVVPDEYFFLTIRAIFTGYTSPLGEKVALIQYFDKRKILSTNGISIFHSGNIYKKVEGIGVTIDGRLSAMIRDRSLKFSSFHTVRQIFDLSEYYKEATDSDIRDFAATESISVGDVDQLISISDTWVRRKLALIRQSRIMELVPMNEIKAVALEFNIALTTRTVNGAETIVLPQNKSDLKKILRFLDEDYYMSPLSQRPHLTNSKREVPI